MNTALPTLTPILATFPATRYQGSKRRSARWIVERLAPLDVRTVLDAFGGTGAVAYAFKSAGLAVTYNDLLAFNHQIGLALIENDGVRLSDEDIEALVGPRPGLAYPDFIERSFDGVYFTREENRWLDMAAAHVRGIESPLKRALAYYALFQSAIAKRPYNLFHRKNLYLRFAEVPRGFGNKAAWDRPFEEHFRRHAAAANAAVFKGDLPCGATMGDAVACAGDYDLVYIDPPYVNSRGVGVDYREFYHFLEGMIDYDRWPERIDFSSLHRRLVPMPNDWCRPAAVGRMFAALFDRFRSSVLAVSYRSDGIPSIDELTLLLKNVKRRVQVHVFESRPYALSINRAKREVLLVGE